MIAPLFCLVASPDPAKLAQGMAFYHDLKSAGYQLEGVIINRAYPAWFLQPAASNDDVQAQLEQQMRAFFLARIEQGTRLGSDQAGSIDSTGVAGADRYSGGGRGA